MEPSFFNLFDCGENLMNRLDATCKQVCMANPRDKYYSKLHKTLTDYNDRNIARSCKSNIREGIHRVMEEESISDTNKINADTFSHGTNTKIEKANAIFTS